MARVFTEGAEFGDDLFFEVGHAGVTTTKRSGVYAYYAQAGGSYGSPTKLFPEHLSELYIRFGSMYSGGDAADLFKLYHGATEVVCLMLDTGSMLLKWQVGGATVATADLNWTSGVWHLLDMYINIGTSGSLMLKYDGVLDACYFGDTRGGSQTEVDRATWSVGYHVGVYPLHYFDDIALNDTSGDADNSWCGDGHVELLKPNLDGDTLQWTPSSGSDHYAMVDDVPPDDDTTYVSVNEAGLQDMYNLADFNDSNKLVRRIIVEGRLKDASASSQPVKLGMKTSGSVFLCEEDRILSYNYTRVVGDNWIVDPNTGVAWTKSALDSLQFVVES